MGWLELFLFYTIVYSGALCTGNNNMCPNKCRCEEQKAYCVYSRLIYIPSLPPNITFLEFRGNYLQHITRNTFRRINNITVLYLSYNHVISIAKDALDDMIFLKRFGLSHEININVEQLANLLHSVTRSIEYIGFTHMHLDILPNLDGLINTTLKEIDFNHNYMRELNGFYFKNLRNLRDLDFSYNALDDVYSFEGLQMITNLKLGGNWFRNFPNFTNMQQLKSLHIQNTKISTFLQRNFEGLDNLEYLNLNGHAVRVLYNNTYSKLKSLHTLELRRLSGQLDYINMYAFNSSSLRNLFLNNNHFYFKNTNVVLTDIFAHAPNLQCLDISYNYIKLNETEFLTMISSLKILKSLSMVNVNFNLSSNQLSYYLTSLYTFNLSRNSISGWNGNALFENFSSLRVIDLSHNRITKVNESSFPVTIRKSKHFHLYLGGNPFSCSCNDIKWFYKWIHSKAGSTALQLNITTNEYKCSSPYSLHDRNIQHLGYRDVCPIDPTLIKVVISCASMIVSVLLSVFILYKCRWHIRYRLFKLTQRRKRRLREGRYAPLPGENDFFYDCFPVYADEDIHFVKNKLVNILEERNNRKLCIRDRDFAIGGVFVDHITESIEDSRKILLLISNNFARSRWCRFQLQIALYRMAEENRNALVTVLLQEISYKYLTNTLRTILVTSPYITWSEESSAERLFYENLLQEIPASSLHRMESVLEEADHDNNIVINSG